MTDEPKQYLAHVTYGHPPKFMTIDVPPPRAGLQNPYQVLVDEIERLRARLEDAERHADLRQMEVERLRADRDRWREMTIAFADAVCTNSPTAL